jgi:hypothetical protein
MSNWEFILLFVGALLPVRSVARVEEPGPKYQIAQGDRHLSADEVIE